MECNRNKKFMDCNKFIIQSTVRSALSKLGHLVGRYPFRSCIIPLILTAVLSLGLFSLRFVKSYEHLYSPINGRSFKEREAVESLFPLSRGGVNLISITRFQHVVSVIIVPKDDGSVLREVIMDEAASIESYIYNITVPWRNYSISLKDICSKTLSGDCQPNDVLELRGKIKDIRSKKILIKYPFCLDDISQRMMVYGIGLGGVSTDGNENVLEAKALRLVYALNYTTTEYKEVGTQWQESFLEEVSNLKSDHVRIVRFSGITMDKELMRVTELSLPLIPKMIPIMLVFAILTCLTTDCVSSKPWVAVAGCICPALGGLSGIGLMMLIGVPYVDINIAIPFLLTGIGLDDSFIMLSAWRRTDPKQSVEERTSQTYSEAAVSITITSLTNFLSFCVGIGTPYRMAQIYCSYAAVSIFISYVYQITFFGGALALSGMQEERRLHSFLCFAVEPYETTESASLKSLCIWGGQDRRNRKNAQRKPCFIYPLLEMFLSFIVTIPGKATVIAMFVLYLLSSAYFLPLVEEGMDFRDATVRNSYFVDFITEYYKHFTQYDQPIHLVINKTLDYSDKQVQKNIENLIKDFTVGPNMADEKYSISWLKYYVQSTKDKKFWFAYYGYNMSDPKDFIEGLRNVFLKFRNAQDFKRDIKFNSNGTEITASRFIIFGKNVDTSFEQSRLLKTMWKKADSSMYPTFVHNFWFPAYNVLTSITPVCITTVCIACGIVSLLFFIMIPDIFCCVSIMLAIGSIQIGVIGYMSWWKISLGMISVTCLIISVGLSVDYASHISYAYLSCKESNPNKKTQVALRETGYPIIQGCASTILSVVLFFLSICNSLLIFVKMMMLVLTISLFHGIFVIPILLNIFDTARTKLINHCRKRFHKINEGEHLKETVC